MARRCGRTGILRRVHNTASGLAGIGHWAPGLPGMYTPPLLFLICRWALGLPGMYTVATALGLAANRRPP